MPKDKMPQITQNFGRRTLPQIQNYGGHFAPTFYSLDMPEIYQRYARYIPEICQRNKQKKLGQNVHYFYESWGKMSVGQNVLGAKCPLAGDLK